MFRSVLITGGTGTLGNALTRHLLDNKLSERICIYSRGEHAQAAMRERFNNDPRLRWFIGDVRDLSRLRRACQRNEPTCGGRLTLGVDLVIHAAALKRIEVGHYNPIEMCKTNVEGTSNVIEAAQDAGVRKVVFISSDKAFQPVSAYGFSKALGEALILAANNTTGDTTKLAAVRYGNVWNSNGSVVPKWRDMLAAGAKEVPLTDPNCTRFFMKIDEAVNLVLSTAQSMKGGELAIPTLPAYRMGDLAKAFGVRPRVVGLPSWEKLAEAMSPDQSSDKARRMSIAELKDQLAV